MPDKPPATSDTDRDCAGGIEPISGKAVARSVRPGDALRVQAQLSEPIRQLALGPSHSVRDALKALQFPGIVDSLAQARALIAENPMGALVRDMEVAQEQLRALTRFPLEQFRSPAALEIGRLMAQLDRNPVAEWMRSEHARTQRQMQEAMAAIRQPFLGVGRELACFNAAFELQTIGLAVRNDLGFDIAFARMLRDDLGDWRQMPEETTQPDDVEGRAALYVARGMDPALTAFPAPTFADLLDRAGLVLPALPEERGAAMASTEFDGSKSAYAWLLHFEHAMRGFIDQAMTRAVGPGWILQRVPADILTRWKARQQEAAAARMDRRSLLEHADFMDYPQIITRKDNWRDVFKPVFAREDNVRESFHRLKPVRNATMHAALITQQDLLLMCVEIHRLMRAMRP